MSNRDNDFGHGRDGMRPHWANQGGPREGVQQAQQQGPQNQGGADLEPFSIFGGDGRRQGRQPHHVPHGAPPPPQAAGPMPNAQHPQARPVRAFQHPPRAGQQQQQQPLPPPAPPAEAQGGWQNHWPWQQAHQQPAQPAPAAQQDPTLARHIDMLGQLMRMVHQQQRQIQQQQGQIEDMVQSQAQLERQIRQPRPRPPPRPQGQFPQGSLDGLANVLTLKYRPQRDGLYLNALSLFYRNTYRYHIRRIGTTATHRPNHRTFNAAGFRVGAFLHMLAGAYALRHGRDVQDITIWVEQSKVVAHPDWQDVAHLGVVRQLHGRNFVVASRACLLHDIASLRPNRRRGGGGGNNGGGGPGAGGDNDGGGGNNNGGGNNDGADGGNDGGRPDDETMGDGSSNSDGSFAIVGSIHFGAQGTAQLAGGEPTVARSVALSEDSWTDGGELLDEGPSTGAADRPGAVGDSEDSDGPLRIDNAGPNDCVAGRGAHTNHHLGTIKFREMVDKRKLEYLLAGGLGEKQRIRDEIISAWQGEGRRFLKGDKQNGFRLMTAEEVKRKTSQRLRERPDLFIRKQVVLPAQFENHEEIDKAMGMPIMEETAVCSDPSVSLDCSHDGSAMDEDVAEERVAGAARDPPPDFFDPIISRGENNVSVLVKRRGRVAVESNRVYLVKAHDPEHAYKLCGKASILLDNQGEGWGEIEFAYILPRDRSSRRCDGAVFLEPAPDDVRFVAVKNVKKEAVRKSLETGGLKDPYKEISFLQQLGDGVNVLPCIEALETKDSLFLVTSYCHDGSLMDNLPWGTGYSEIEARGLFQNIIQILLYLEHHGVCHRDISPRNLLFLGNRLVLSDFSMALRIPRDKSGGSCLIKPQGTPANFSSQPVEVFLNAPFDGVSVDLWGAAVTLYALLTGKHLYRLPHPYDVSFRLFVMLNGLEPSVSQQVVDRLATAQDVCPAVEENLVAMAMANLSMSPDALDVLINVLQSSHKKRWTLRQTAESPWVSGLARTAALSPAAVEDEDNGIDPTWSRTPLQDSSEGLDSSSPKLCVQLTQHSKRHGLRCLEVWQGDITNPVEPVDILVISACNGEYRDAYSDTCRKSVIRSLEKRHEISITNTFEENCGFVYPGKVHVWISNVLPEALPFRQILCVSVAQDTKEATPRLAVHPLDETIKRIFSCVASMDGQTNFAGTRSIAIPMVGETYHDKSVVSDLLLRVAKTALEESPSCGKVLLYGFSEGKALTLAKAASSVFLQNSHSEALGVNGQLQVAGQHGSDQLDKRRASDYQASMKKQKTTRGKLQVAMEMVSNLPCAPAECGGPRRFFFRAQHVVRCLQTCYCGSVEDFCTNNPKIDVSRYKCPNGMPHCRTKVPGAHEDTKPGAHDP